MADTIRAVDRGRVAPAATGWSIPWGRVLTYGVLILGTALALGPFIWVLSASLMSTAEIAAGRVLPSTPIVENYARAWEMANLALYFWNSIRVALIAVVGELIFCVPAAYAFARMQFYGRNTLFTLMLATMMIPAIATLIPNYLTVVWISRLSESVCGEACKWLDSWPALTIPFMATPFSIFLLRQFFAQIPQELWEAARIDGAGHLRFLWSVIMPLSRAPILTIALFAFIGSWNALMWPLLVVQTDTWRPIAFGLLKFVSNDAPSELSLQMAAVVIMIAPMLVLYFFTQKSFTEGIASSGLKG
jgi:ABC-type glycerol-3-phosphate transport system permease component